MNDRQPTVPSTTTVARDIAAEHPAFAGHFPGQPVLPGVVLLAEVLEAVLDLPSLAALLGPQPTLSAVKFLAPVGPASALSIRLQADAHGLRFEVRCAGVAVASGRMAPGAPL